MSKNASKSEGDFDSNKPIQNIELGHLGHKVENNKTNEESDSEDDILSMFEQGKEGATRRNCSQYITHEVLIHNIDTSLSGASTFINQAFDSVV